MRQIKKKSKHDERLTVHHTDVAIIGSGPVGLFTIFECGMHKLNCHVFDALNQLGGQCSALYPHKPIYDIPAYPKVTGQELVDNLVEQAQAFKPTYHLGQQVTGIEQQDAEGKVWKITTNKGVVVMCKSIIIAAGVGAFGPNRPPLDGIENYEPAWVHYAVRNPEQFKDKTVVIAGGGDSAIDWAIVLKDIAQKVFVVHRRAKFRAAPESESKLMQAAQKGELELVTPFQLASLHGTDGKLKAVGVKTLEGESRELKTDYLLPFFGLSMNLGPIAEWELGFSKNHIATNQGTSQTSRPGIYAVGDIATYEHKQKLILTGFAEAAQAAHSIRSFLYPDEIIHFEYSTTKGVNGLN